MRLAQTEDGIVVNVIEVDPENIPDWCEDWIEVEEAGIGWTWDGDSFAAPPEPSPEELAAQARATIPPLSFAQLLIGLVTEEWITEEEGEVWLSGQGLPAAALAVIGQLTEAQRFPAKAKMLRLSAAERLDPLVEALATAEGKTPEQIDAFFLTYGQV